MASKPEAKKHESKPEVKPEVKPEPKLEVKSAVASAPVVAKPELKPEVKPTAAPAPVQVPTVAVKPEVLAAYNSIVAAAGGLLAVAFPGVNPTPHLHMNANYRAAATLAQALETLTAASK
jgi:hypothetical protein